MALFPLFVDLRGKKCVVVGGGNVAVRKVEVLLQFGADVTVVSPEVTEKLEVFKREYRIAIIREKYSEGDLEGAFLAIAATSDKKANEKVYEDAVRDGIFINVADSPERCTFTFPSVVKRGELVVGISTSGGYPALSKKVREKIEEVIPESYESILFILKECRRRAAAEINNLEKRREALNKILDEVILYEGAAAEHQLNRKIESIFEVYKNEKEN